MNGSELKFGKFVEQKRKEQGITLRGLASKLNIAPAYMSDMEKGRRYPPVKEKLYEIVRVLSLSETDKNLMFDMAAAEKENMVSADLTEYIMGRDIVRDALRKARDANVSDEDWKRFIKLISDNRDSKFD